jgi:SET family sugar efflux transporter-like MFS transporter
MEGRQEPGLTPPKGNRLLVPSVALLWGLQFAFLNPALALLLVTLFTATATQVGTVLAVYNASGFVASLVLPAYADRTRSYLRVMLLCGALTLALAALLAATTSLPAAVLGLVVFGGPAGVGSSLLFAHLKDSGASPSDVVNTRAIVSFAWVAGPPLATLTMSTFGNRSILLAIAAVAAANVATTAAMLAQRSAAGAGTDEQDEAAADGPGLSRAMVAVILGVSIVLQATNSATVSVMTLFVAETLRLDVTWAGVALAVAAALEVPALLLTGRLNRRFSSLTLIAAGCPAGIAFYAGMAAVSGPLLLLALQLAQRRLLRRRRRGRPGLVPRNNPSARPCLRSLHQHPAAGSHRLRPDHRPGLPGPGIPRRVRSLRRPHRARADRARPARSRD